MIEKMLNLVVYLILVLGGAVLLYALRKSRLGVKVAALAFLCVLSILTILGYSFLIHKGIGQPQTTQASGATCYWVGDTNPAVWNDATHWSNATGGAGSTCDGGIVPDSTDTAVFDSANANNVNVDISISVVAISNTNYAGTLDTQNNSIAASGNFQWNSGTFTAGSSAISVGGNWSTNGGTFTANTSGVTFDAADTDNTITTGNQAFNNVTFNNAAGRWALQDTSTVSGNLTVTNSETAGNGVDLNGQTLTLTGNFQIDGGKLTTGASAWSVAGNWTRNVGTVTATSSTITFNAGDTGNTITSGSQAFNNVTFDNAAGGWSFSDAALIDGNFLVTNSETTGNGVNLNNQTIGVTGNFTMTAGKVTAGSSTVTVAGNWNTSAATFSSGTSTVDLTGTGSLKAKASQWSAPRNFYNLKTAHDTKTTTQTSTVTVTNLWYVYSGGTHTGNATIFLYKSDSDPIVDTGAVISSSVYYNSTGNLSVAGHNFTNEARYTSGSISAGTITYTLTSNFTGNGWITIAGWQNKQVVLDSSSSNISAGELWLFGTDGYSAGGTILLNGGTHSFTGNFIKRNATTNTGDTANFGTSNTSIGGNVNFTGITVTPGSSTVTMNAGDTNNTITSASQHFNNLAFNNAAGRWALQDTTAVDGNLTVTNSETAGNGVDLNGKTVDVNGNVQIDAGKLTTGASSMNVGGNWTRNGGTVTATSSTITFDGAAGQTITSGSQSFNALTITNAHADGVTFADRLQTATLTDTTNASKLKFVAATALAPHTVSSTLTLTGGVDGNMVTLAPSVAATTWYFSPPASTTVTGVNVSYSSSDKTITANSSNNGGNNVNWTFGAVNRYWVKATTGNWNDITNWSDATGGPSNYSVPVAGDAVYFDGSGVGSANIDMAAAAASLTIGASYTGTITINSSQSLTLTGAFTQSGTTATFNSNGQALSIGSYSQTTGTMTCGASSITNSGDFSITSGTFNANTSTWNFTAGDTGNTITSGGKSFYNIVFNNAAGGWALQDTTSATNNFTITNSETVGNGVNLNNQTVGVTGNFTISAGKVTAGSSTINVAGSWSAVDNTTAFIYNTSTVNLTGSANLGITGVEDKFYNITFAAATKTTTLVGVVGFYGQATLGTGTLTGNYGLAFRGSAATPLVNGGATVNISQITYRPSIAGTYNIAGGTYTLGGIYFFPSINSIYNLTSDLTVNTGGFMFNNSSTLNSQDHSINIDHIHFSNGAPGSVTINMGNSTVTIGTGGIYVDTNGGTHTLNLNTAIISNAGQWKNVAGTGTITVNPGTSTVTLTGNAAAHQTITTNAQAFNNLTINNTQATYDQAIISGTLDVNGTLTITDGNLKLDTNNPAVNTSGNVSIGVSGAITKGTNTWTFDGITATTYTDSTAIPQNIGITAITKTDVTPANNKLTLASSMTVDTMTISANNTLDLASSGYTLKLANAGATATVLTVTGTLTPGANSTVQYTAANSGGNVNVTTTTYNNLQFTPGSAETYDMTSSLSAANAMTGSLTIDTNATLDLRPSVTNYDITAVNVAINGVLDAASSSSAITASGNWTNSGTFTAGTSTVTCNAATTGKILSGTMTSASAFYNLTFNNAAGGWTLQDTTSATNNFTITTSETAGNGVNLNNQAVNIDGNFQMDAGKLTMGSAAVTAGSSWTINGGTQTPNTSGVTFDATATGKTIKSSSQSFATLTFNGSGGGWTLQDNLTASSLTVTLGTLVDNAKTVTVNGDISIATGATLTSTGPWIQGTSGSASNTNESNAIYSLRISNSATSTIPDAMRVKKIILDTGSTATGAGGLVIIDNAVNDPLDINATADITAAGGVLLKHGGSAGATITQKAFTITTNFDVLFSSSSILQATGNWTFGGGRWRSASTAISEATSGRVDMNSYNITANGNLVLGNNASNAYFAKVQFGSGTHTITGNISVHGSATHGYFDLGSSNISVGGNIDFTYGTVTPGTSTVTMNAGDTDNTITSASQHFNNLAFNNAAGRWTLQDAAAVDGNLTVTNSETVGNGVNFNNQAVDIGGNVQIDAGKLTAGSSLINVGGSWTRNGGTFTANTSGVTFDGTSGTKTITSGSQAFNNVTFNDGGGTATYRAADALDVNGTFTLTDGVLDLDTNDPTVNIAGNTTINNGSVTKGSGTVTFDGDLSYDDNVGSVNFGNIAVGTSPDTTTLESNLVCDSLTINSGDILTTQGYDIDCGGNVRVIGTLNATHDDAKGGAASINLTGDWNTTGGSFTRDTSTVTLDGVAGQTVTSDGELFNNLTITNASAAGVTFADRLQTTNLTDTTAGSKVSFSAESFDARHTVSGALTLTGGTGASMITLAPAVAAVNWYFSPPAATTATGVNVSFSNSDKTITANSSNNGGNNINWVFGANTRYWVAASSGNWNQAANWSDTSGGAGGQTIPAPGDTVVYNGAGVGNSVINVPAYAATLTVQSGYSGTISFNSGLSLTVSGDLTVSDGTFNAGSSNITVGGNIYLTGVTFNPGTSTVTLNAADTGNTITSGSQQFNNLTFNNAAGGWAFQDTISIAGNLVVTNSETVGNGVNFNNQAVDIGGNVQIDAGKLTAGSALINVGGSWTRNGGTFVANTSGVTFDAGATGKTITSGSQSFNNVTFNNAAGGWTLQDDLTVAGTFTLTNGEFSAGTSNDITVAGNWTVNGGTINASGSTVTFDGSAAQLVTSGGQSFNNLTITNASVAGTTFADGATVAGTFADNTGDSKITFHAGATYTFTIVDIDGTSGHNVNLVSSAPGTAWILNVAAANPTVSYVAVADSDASGGSAINASNNCTNNLGNTNWFFTGPSNNSLTFTNPYGGAGNTVIADDTIEWNFQAVVTDSNGLNGVNYVELRLGNAADVTTPYDSLKLRWTRATDTFSEITDTQNAATLTSTGADSSSAGNTWTLNFKLQINANFLALDTNYNAQLYSLDISGLAGDTDYANFYQVSALSLSFTLDSSGVNFGDLTPGTPKTASSIATVTTNAPAGYTLSISDGISGDDSALVNSAGIRIKDYSSLISNPSLWSGAGLGFCIYSATGKEAKWGTGVLVDDLANKYAGIPESTTVIHAKSASPTLNDQTSIGYKLDVLLSQPATSYLGPITLTVTEMLY